MAVAVEALTSAGIPQAAVFLNRHLNDRVQPAVWASAIKPPWSTPQPNHGFILRHDESVVGVLLAFYSERTVANRTEKFCNLGAWCVLPDFRFQSLRLLRTALAQDGFSFTDLSPSGAVIPLNTRLGFTTLDTTSFAVPCVPLPPLGATRVVSSATDIRAALSGEERRVFDDHQGAAAVHHVLLLRPEGHCYVMYRRDRRKGLPVFASILYASERRIFAKGAAALASHVAFRHRVVALLVENRVAERPTMAIALSRSRPKMYRSRAVTADAIDYLYSELCCVPW